MRTRILLPLSTAGVAGLAVGVLSMTGGLGAAAADDVAVKREENASALYLADVDDRDDEPTGGNAADDRATGQASRDRVAAGSAGDASRDTASRPARDVASRASRDAASVDRVSAGTRDVTSAGSRDATGDHGSADTATRDLTHDLTGGASNVSASGDDSNG